jgi:hypothetical protein
MENIEESKRIYKQYVYIRKHKEKVRDGRDTGTPSPDVEQNVTDTNFQQNPSLSFPEVTASPLTHLFWWDLLMSIWSMAQQYKFEWADDFLPHIVNLDTDWLKSAMAQTFQRLNAAHQQLLREEYDGFIALDKVCDWKLMCRGHEYIAVLCTRYFPDVRLKRSVYAWSLAEAKAKYTPTPTPPTPASVETLLGWMRPWDSDYIRIEQKISGIVAGIK